MSLHVYTTPRFDKQLESLGATDKRGELAGRRAAEVIDDLLQNGWSQPKDQNKLTKKGELRLKNCIKYDLGSGFRMVGLLVKNSLYLLYLGSHDDCDRWLNRRRGVGVEIVDENLLFYELNHHKKAGEESRNDVVESLLDEDEYEAQLFDKLDDRTLRQIFHGLCKK